MKELTLELGNLDQDTVATAAFNIIDRIQTYPPAIQIQAASVVFLLMIDVFGLDVRRELERTERIMKDADKRYNYLFNSIRAYIEGELS